MYVCVWLWAHACSDSAPPQADLLGVTVERPANVETTAAGAAIAAGIGAGVWSGPEAVQATAAEVERAFTPAITPEERAQRLESWGKAVECSLGWAGRP